MDTHLKDHEFTTIFNLRDLGESIPGCKTKLYPNMLFRSATLDFASNEEMDMLVGDLRIKTVLDLRSELEAKLSELGKPFTVFPIMANIKLDPSDMTDPHPAPEPITVIKEDELSSLNHLNPTPNTSGRRRSSISNFSASISNSINSRRSSISSSMDRFSIGSRNRKQSIAGHGGAILSRSGVRKTIMVNFAGTKFRKHAVWWPAPFWCKIKLAGLVLAGQKMSAAKLAGVEVMNKKKLEGLYKDFVDYCDQEINEALHILASPGNYPVLVHCTHGKDRTGLVIALALAAVGVDEEEIFQDYHKSTEGLRKIHPKMVEELAVNGLDPCFAETPYETMKATFAYIKGKYKSVETYLDHIGFSERSRMLLKVILVDNRSKPKNGHEKHHHTVLSHLFHK